MTTEERLMTILERANPVPSTTVADVPISAPRYLEDLQQRSSTVSIRTTDTPTTRRRWAMLGAAAAVILLVVVAAFVIGGNDSNIVVDTPESTTSTPTTTSTVAPSPGASADAAQTVVDGLFGAYNAGDTDELLDLFASDVVVTEVFDGPVDPGAEPELRSEWEQLTAFRNAGWSLADRDCALAAEQPSEGTTFSCDYDTVTTVMQAVGSDPSPTKALITVVDGSITEYHVAYGQPPFDSVAGPFTEWMRQYHSDVVGVGLFEWATVEEAAEDGRVRARWALEWASWLDTYGCRPDQACSISIEEWVAEYDSQCLALDSIALPTNELVERMKLLPPTNSGLLPVTRLVGADDELLAADATTDRIAELQQQRLDAMVELGIDERCHPVIE